MILTNYINQNYPELLATQQLCSPSSCMRTGAHTWGWWYQLQGGDGAATGRGPPHSDSLIRASSLRRTVLTCFNCFLASFNHHSTSLVASLVINMEHQFVASILEFWGAIDLWQWNQIRCASQSWRGCLLAQGRPVRWRWSGELGQY